MSPGLRGSAVRGGSAVRAGQPVACLALVASIVLAACGPGASPSPSAAASGPRASPSPSAAASFAIASPAVGLLTDIDAEGLTRVTGFRLRMDDGAEVQFRIGILENGAEFPPGHLAEHMSTTTKVRVFFRDEGGERVVYRLEDAE